MVNPNTKRLWVHLTGPQHVNPLPRRCHPCSISEQNLQQIAGAKFRALALISLAPSLPVDHFELSACMHACMRAFIHISPSAPTRHNRAPVHTSCSSAMASNTSMRRLWQSSWSLAGHRAAVRLSTYWRYLRAETSRREEMARRGKGNHENLHE